MGRNEEIQQYLRSRDTTEYLLWKIMKKLK
jgi:hypothetical protein